MPSSDRTLPGYPVRTYADAAAGCHLVWHTSAPSPGSGLAQSQAEVERGCCPLIPAVLRGAEVSHQAIDPLGRDAQLDAAFSGRRDGGCVILEPQLRVQDQE